MGRLNHSSGSDLEVGRKNNSLPGIFGVRLRQLIFSCTTVASHYEGLDTQAGDWDFIPSAKTISGQDSESCLKKMNASETATYIPEFIFYSPWDTARLISQSFCGYVKLDYRILTSEI